MPLHSEDKSMCHPFHRFDDHVTCFSTDLQRFLHSSVSLMMPAINTQFIHLHQSFEKSVFAYMTEVRGMILRRFLLMLQEFSFRLSVDIFVHSTTLFEI